MHYVYAHIDPETSQLLYVGQGQRHRAWEYYSHPRPDGTYWVGRTPEHRDHLLSLVSKGYLPCDWVHIVERQLSKKDAKQIEHDLIELTSPMFNKKPGLAQLALTKDQVARAIQMRKDGKYFREIAEEFNVATMTIHRMLAGKSIRYRELI